MLIIDKRPLSKQWITLGIKPTKPSEAYGYIQVSKNDNNIPKKVLKFIENHPKNCVSIY